VSKSPPRRFGIPSRVFTAQYRGKCGRCGQRFPAGSRIRYVADKTVAHEGCVVRDEVSRKNMPSHNPSTRRRRKPNTRRRGVATRLISDPVLSDEMARENMRSHKPSTWRRGKSPSSYG
jgi:hypothetical protein